MKITNVITLRQALANIRLESLSLPKDVEELLEEFLADPSISLDTKDIEKMLLSKYNDNMGES